MCLAPKLIHSVLSFPRAYDYCLKPTTSHKEPFTSETCWFGASLLRSEEVGGVLTTRRQWGAHIVWA